MNLNQQSELVHKSQVLHQPIHCFHHGKTVQSPSLHMITLDHYDLTLLLICSDPCNKSCPVSFSISVCGTESGDVISVVEIVEK